MNPRVITGSALVRVVANDDGEGGTDYTIEIPNGTDAMGVPRWTDIDHVCTSDPARLRGIQELGRLIDLKEMRR